MFAGTKNPHNLYQTLKPIFLTSRLFGLSPFGCNDVKGYFCSRKHAVYSYSFAIIYCGYYVSTLYQRHVLGFHENSKVSGAIEMFRMYSGIIVMVTIICMNNLRKRKLLEALQTLASVDEKLKSFSFSLISAPYHSRSSKIILGYLFYRTSSTVILEAFDCNMFTNEMNTLYSFCWSLCYVPLLGLALFECQFLSFLLLIYDRFRLLNHELKKLIASKKPSTIFVVKKRTNTNVKAEDKVRFLRKLHGELCFISSSFNDCFSAQILLLLGVHFVIFVTRAYTASSSFVKLMLVKEDFYDVTTNLAWTVHNLLSLFVVCVASTLTTNQVQFAREIIQKLDVHYEKNLRSEVSLFGGQMMHWKLQVTAWGLFDIDMTLFQAVLSAATTYFIILIQLESSSNILMANVET